MRVVVFCALVAACGAPPATVTPKAAPSSVESYVLDEHGPVGEAQVRLVALPSGRCPCANQLDTSGHGNEMPECACPQALASWRSRLASCQWPAQVVSTVPADDRGHATLQRLPGVTGIEVARNDRVRWLPWPSTRDAISLELAPSSSPRVQIVGDAHAGDSLRGAFLFDDGHCVPLDHQGSVWVPRVPLPRFGGVLVVEAKGYATILYSLFDQENIEVELLPDVPITGTCEGKTARFDNPFQHVVTKIDHNKTFSFTGAIAIESKISCWADAETSTGEWTHRPGGQLEEDASVVYGSPGSCQDIQVIDSRGRPIADADVSVMTNHGGGYSSGTGATTDARGIACIDDLYRGQELTVRPPGSAGGQCAGELRMKVTAHHQNQNPLVLRLRYKKLPQARPRGRVVNADGLPVAGAYVGVGDIEPSSVRDCSDSGGDSVTTAVDGTFELPPQPRGRLTLGVQHDWYPTRQLTIKNDGSAHDIVLPSGDRFTGRLLDPDGKPITDCSMFLTLANGRLMTDKCSASGFSFVAITPGEADVQVRLEKHALGEHRTLRKKIQFKAGKPHVEDIAFPRGENISGRIVDTYGNPIVGAYITTLPRGTVESDRIHDDRVSLVSDAGGRFTFRHLRPGTWTLRGDRRSGRETTLDVVAGTSGITLVVPDNK